MPSAEPRARRAALLALVLAAGCSSEAGGPVVRFDPAGHDFLSVPFPNDLLRRPDGTLDLSRYPAPPANSLVRQYLAAGETLHGFGTQPFVYFAVEGGDLDPASLPRDVADTLLPGAPAYIVDVDPRSTHWGERFPVSVSYDAGGGSYLPPHTLVLVPAWGFPLRGETLYAAVVTRRLRDAAGRRLRIDPRLRGVLSHAYGRGASDSVYAPLAAWFSGPGAGEAEDAAGAAVFTTQDPTAELRAIADHLAALGPPATVADAVWRPEGTTDELGAPDCVTHPSYTLLTGDYGPSPNLQEGDPPYLEQGGAFRFDASGMPIVQRWETLRFALTVPTGAAPGSGWPVVMYAHGTGGDYCSFTHPGDGTGRNLAAMGLAVLGIDQPLHGPRSPGAPVDIASFNFFNLDAGRTTFRQSVVDTLWLERMLRGGVALQAASPAGNPVVLDPDRVYYMGHSQGGLTGSMLLAVDGSLGTAVLSGAGGGLAVTIEMRKDPIDFERLFRTALGEFSPLPIYHPGIALTQMLAEVTDPENYARGWIDAPPGGPKNVLMTEGLLDPYTPFPTAEALAAAGGLPIVGAVAHPVEALEIEGFFPVTPPVVGNRSAPGGAAVTAGLLQYPNFGHYAVFQSTDAIRSVQTFLGSAAQGGAPTLE